MATRTHEATRRLQTDLNFFTAHFLDGHAPLIVDGIAGPALKRRVRIAKHQLGYDSLTQEWTDKQQARLRHPKDPKLARHEIIARGNARRQKQRQAWEHNLQAAAHRNGVGTFDGKPVAKFLIPYLAWARDKGDWQGQLESGWRDPVFSEHLCLVMCGAPSCPGRCAGRVSNHSGSQAPPAPAPHGAVDVTDFARFGEAMKRCPIQPPIFNALPNDPVHFSPTGQ
jgi:hypothetical protein